MLSTQYFVTNWINSLSELGIPISDLHGTQWKQSLLFDHCTIIQITKSFDAKLLFQDITIQGHIKIRQGLDVKSIVSVLISSE